MQLPTDRRYTAEHEWAMEDADLVIVGLTAYASEQLGDIVFVDLPNPGTDVYAGQVMGEVESTKSVSDVYSPLMGTIAEKNGALDEIPQLINDDPYDKGWLVKIRTEDGLSGLLTAEAYRQLTGH